MTKFKILVGIFACLLIVSPLAVLAVGQTTEPILVDNALRGEEFEQKMIIINTDGEQMNIDLSARGEVATWVTFYEPADLENPIESISIPAENQTANVVAVFNVPEDTANGVYKGYIGVAQGAQSVNDQEGSLVNVSQQIDREVTIIVTDQEIINLAVSVIPAKYDMVKDEALSVRLIYDNQSNVSLRPEVQFKIRQGDQTVYNSIFPYPEDEPSVRPSSQHEIPALEIATSGLNRGKYIAELTFLHNGEEILVKDFTFSVDYSGRVLGAMDFGAGIKWALVFGALVIFAAAAGLLVWRGKRPGSVL